jgi:uncharacterized protein (DUF1499 family)
VKEVTMRSGRKLSAFGVVAGVLTVVGPLLAYLGIVRPFVGFLLFALGGILSVLLAIGAIVRLVRGRGLTLGSATSLVVAAVFLGLMVSGSDHPRINDFTTDVNDPPALRFAATLPANQGRDLSYPPAFASIQRQCCADLQGVHVPVAPPEALERARRLAESQPTWRVTHTDPETGTVEAVATSKLFHFQDDIVIRVRPEAEGGSLVDMRSKSRDGQGDFGVNAARIRQFMVALRTADGSR